MVCVWAGKGWVGVTTVQSALPPFFSAKALVHPHASNTHVSPLLLRFLLLFFSSPFFLPSFFSFSFQSSWLQGRDGRNKQRARAFNYWRRPGGQGWRRQQQNHQHCSLKVKAACTLPFRQEPPPSLNQIGGASVKTRGKHGGWTRQK